MSPNRPLILFLAVLAGSFLVTGCDFKPKNLGSPVAVVQGKVPTHGLLGVEFADNQILKVDAVVKDSPAQLAGIAPDDEIVAVAGVTVRNLDDLIGQLQTTSPGDTVLITTRRGDVEQAVEVRTLSFHDLVILREANKQQDSEPMSESR